MLNANINSNSDSNFDEFAIQEAYQHIHSKWTRVCGENRLLVSQKDALIKSNEKLEMKGHGLESLVAENEANLKEISTELERT